VSGCNLEEKLIKNHIILLKIYKRTDFDKEELVLVSGSSMESIDWN
jgi:hypothetical protein